MPQQTVPNTDELLSTQHASLDGIQQALVQANREHSWIVDRKEIVQEELRQLQIMEQRAEFIASNLQQLMNNVQNNPTQIG